MASAATSDEQEASLMEFYGEETATKYKAMMDSDAKEKATIEKAAADLLAMVPAGPILDTSSGTGDLLAAIHRLDPARPLAGIDLSRYMLEKAMESVPKAVFRQANMLSFDMKEISIDPPAGLVSFFALHHVPDADAAQAAIDRWAKMMVPGGVMLLGLWEGDGDMPDWHEDGDGDGGHEDGDEDGDDKGKHDEPPSDAGDLAAMQSKLPKVPMKLWPQKSVKDWIRAAGLSLQRCNVTKHEFGKAMYAFATKPSE